LKQHNNRVLFFIHGVGGSSETWKSQLQYFVSAGYEVVAPDLLGHGFSTAPDDIKLYKHERLYAILSLIFDKTVGRGKKAVIVGHSYG
jgi:abhydrolase domain-containing protein 8